MSENTKNLNICTHTKNHNAIKHFDIKIKYIRQYVKLKTLQLSHFDSKLTLADSFTQPLNATEHIIQCKLNGIGE